MRLLLENLPPSLRDRRETLGRCLAAFDRVCRVRAVYLFGSHARGQAHEESDVDLCIVADGAEEQMRTAVEFRKAIWPLRPGLSFTLIPITPNRLSEKQAVGDHFFQTILEEGVQLAAED
jgi:hypothetical protein